MDLTPEKILLCLALWFITAISVRFLLKDKRELWFARSKSKSVITLRGALGEWISLGYPVTKEGFAVSALLFLLLAAETLVILLW